MGGQTSAKAPTALRTALAGLVAGIATATLVACDGAAGTDGRLLVVTTVSPITDIVAHVAGEAAEVQGIVPEGADSHTFEPKPSDVRLLARADLVILNGLGLEEPSRRLAEANLKGGAEVFLLGEHAISPDQYVYDFSFPKEGGKPNPHLWTDVSLAIRYAELARDKLADVDRPNAATYRANAEGYIDLLEELDTAVIEAIDTIPTEDRKLLTYHDSFPFFSRRYGIDVIGAIQPSDFSEPSGQDVARLIEQIRAENVPAIFGSEVYPSPVLEQIARETGARYESSLRDDDLPGDPGDPEHSYVGMMLYDVRTIVTGLGGDPSGLDSVPLEPE